MKNKIYDFLIITLLYIGFSCIPFNLFIPSDIWVTVLNILSQIIVIVLAQIILKKSPLKRELKDANKNNIFIFLPVFLVCGSNFFSLFANGNEFIFSFNFKLIMDILLSIFVAFNEEFIFRLLFLSNFFEKEQPIKRVLISSLVFALCHLTHFFSSFNPVDLIDVVYTFGIGIILGMMFIYTKSLALPIIFHALYNVVNGNLSRNWIIFNNGLTEFYITNIIVGAIASIYLIIVYFMVFREVKKS